ncbi:hypothetical protein PtA15_11A596 [Puccinia triticina]|uniref:Uncharacterized protein n=1 Tax=Puccinia triticina TaxID=208348 RepID=A0ABY7CZ66_9BASI|nr:uncharacterized protein PtA15_11A596 [Puccinia triticina]WAQ89904.1 hypothetical protein PtA15_11A596 [Puccinia triticina]WAR59950.1 hypothetical protein PtB15_11B591 [Puccinia triticina]
MLSGKTTRADQIEQLLESKIAQASDPPSANTVILINDALLGLSRAAYDGDANLDQFPPYPGDYDHCSPHQPTINFPMGKTINVGVLQRLNLQPSVSC